MVAGRTQWQSRDLPCQLCGRDLIGGHSTTSIKLPRPLKYLRDRTTGWMNEKREERRLAKLLDSDDLAYRLCKSVQCHLMCCICPTSPDTYTFARIDLGSLSVWQNQKIYIFVNLPLSDTIGHFYVNVGQIYSAYCQLVSVWHTLRHFHTFWLLNNPVLFSVWVFKKPTFFQFLLVSYYRTQMDTFIN